MCGLHTKLNVRFAPRGGMLVLIFIIAGILVCVVGVMLVGVVFFREHSLLVTEVECLGVGFVLVGGSIFYFSGSLWL